METRIKTTDYQLVPEAQSYLDERLAMIEKLLDTNDGAARVDVELGRDMGHKSGNVYFAEINLLVDGRSLRATSHGASVNAAIDEAKDEIMEQLRKRKSLHRRVLRRGGAAFKRIMQFGGGE
ncbi:MAG TPA: HPF/RaiA family ribosome-associated protein [Candidatus Paceibacterota bacterium]|nr:HPF/RaiA family ribosome-associated protein [Candidatus Paceibacterota bacterium]